MALDGYHKTHGTYPESLDLLKKIAGYDSSYLSDIFHKPQVGTGFTGFVYHPHENGMSFYIRMKSNWEDDLFYKSTSATWVYRTQQEGEGIKKGACWNTKILEVDVAHRGQP